MSDLELIDAVAHVTGEDAREIRRRGFILTGPEDAGADLDPECMLDLVDPGVHSHSDERAQRPNADRHASRLHV